MGARKCFKPQGFLPAYTLFVRFVAELCSAGFRFPLPAPSTRVPSWHPFSFFSTHIRRPSTYNDSGDGLHRLPTSDLFEEVHYEQLSVQRVRQQQLDLDHPHRPAVLLLLRRLLNALPASLPRLGGEGSPPFGGSFLFGIVNCGLSVCLHSRKIILT